MNEITRDGSELVKRWLATVDELKRSKDAVNRADCDERNAQSALAKWLMPSDMGNGEKVAVWFGDSLIQVELAPVESFSPGSDVAHVRYEPKVTVRLRGKRFGELS